MKQQVNISDFFPKYLFWDMDPSTLDVSRDKAFIIPRALYATTPDTFETDILKLETLYPTNEIVTYLMQTKENISNMVCDRVCERYDVPQFQRFKMVV